MVQIVIFISSIGTLAKYNLVEDLPFYARKALANAQEINDDLLTIDEIAAINLYTMEWKDLTMSFYFVVNRYLREFDNKSTKYFYPLVKLIVSGLKKLVPFNGTVWRAFNGVANVYTLYKKGQEVCWSAFTSCSSDVSVCGSGFFAAGGENTLFNIQVKRSYSISKYSMVPNESEILLLPGSKLNVVDVLQVNSSLVIVQLQQKE